MKTADITDAQVVEACARYKQVLDAWPPVKKWDGKRSLEILMEATGAPLKVCFRALERAHRRGLINFGTSLCSAWPEPQGGER